MLVSDMALVYSFSLPSDSQPQGIIGQECGPNFNPAHPGLVSCHEPVNTTVPDTFYLVSRFIQDNAYFIHAFSRSFSSMIAVGYSIQGDSAQSEGKLGSLTPIDIRSCS